MTSSPPEAIAEDLQAIDGVPECAISDALAARLPTAAPAPWVTSGSGLAWMHRAAPGAAAHHQRGLTFSRSLPLTFGAFVDYAVGPVGPYHEVLGAPTLSVRNGHVGLPIAFIAVDSEISVAGGRRNWALPKTLADFDWPEHYGVGSRVAATGEGWSMAATVRWAGPRMPLRGRGSQDQVRPDGEVIVSPIRSRAIGRLARIEVHSEGPSLPLWLRSGVHSGLVIERMTNTVFPAVSDPLR